MKSITESRTFSKKMIWAGYILSYLPAVLLILDGAVKLFKPEPVVKATVQLGYPESVIIPLGLVLVISTALYLIPSTAVLGAILVTAYLGGAIATHVRLGESVFSIILPIILSILMWGGLYLRDQRLRALIPFRK